MLYIVSILASGYQGGVPGVALHNCSNCRKMLWMSLCGAECCSSRRLLHALNPTSQGLLMSTVFGMVSSLHLTLDFTLLPMYIRILRTKCDNL